MRVGQCSCVIEACVNLDIQIVYKLKTTLFQNWFLGLGALIIIQRLVRIDLESCLIEPIACIVRI